MNPSVQQLQPHSKISRVSAILFLFFSTIGFIDATYLTVVHYQGESPACSLIHGCDVVTSSSYSLFFGIPVALFGLLFYITVILLSVAYIDRKKEIFLHIIAWLSISSFFASIWFVSLQLFVIHAICIYCMSSAITSTILFITGMVYIWKYQKKQRPIIKKIQ